MIGNMVGTSLAMAPACLVGQSCQIVDLDGPLLLAGDRRMRVSYEHGYLRCDERVWGYSPMRMCTVGCYRAGEANGLGGIRNFGGPVHECSGD